MIYLSIIKNFLLCTRIGRAISVLMLVVAIISLTYYIGFSAGKESLKTAIDKQYAEAVKLEVDKALKKQNALNEIAIQSIKDEQKIEVIYKDKVKIVEKIVKEKSSLASSECSLRDDQLKSFNQELLKIKRMRDEK